MISKDKICSKFEQEVFLFMDNSLPEDSRTYWTNHLEECKVCRLYMKTVEETENTYKTLALCDIDEVVYEKMIQNALEEKSYVGKLFKINFRRKHTYYKLAFTGLVFILTLFMIILFNRGKPSLKINKASVSFDWNAEKIDNRISQIDSSIYLMQNQKKIDYLFEKILQDKWRLKAYTLSRDIQMMEKQLKQSVL